MEKHMIIKNLRLQNGLSQEQLADMTGLSTRTIQRIEKDDKTSLESLKLLAQAFQLEIQELQEKLNNKDLPVNSLSLKENKSLVTFIAVNSMLFCINIITSPEHLWFIYPLLGWGIPLFYKRYLNRQKLLS
jgi:transcriptional regulator with XRE-family HTH domain